MRLLARGLCKRYGAATEPVLRDLDLQLGEGEAVALFGPSGSGKSTLLRLLSLLDEPDAGHIECNGQRIDTLTEPQRTRWRATHVGLVFQSYELIPELRVAQNLALPLRLTGRAAPKALLEQALERVGLAGMSARWPATLSGGEQQRVCVARALIHEPVLILADEPTGNLDPERGLAVLELLREVCRERATSLLLATHSLQALDCVDRALALQRGRLEPFRSAP